MYVACFNFYILSVHIIICVLMYLLYLYVHMYVNRQFKGNEEKLKVVKINKYKYNTYIKTKNNMY